MLLDPDTHPHWHTDLNPGQPNRGSGSTTLLLWEAIADNLLLALQVTALYLRLEELKRARKERNRIAATERKKLAYLEEQIALAEKRKTGVAAKDAMELAANKQGEMGLATEEQPGPATMDQMDVDFVNTEEDSWYKRSK